MKLSLMPKQARTRRAMDAWWYEERGAIRIYIQPIYPGPTWSCSIKRSQLLKYIERSKEGKT